eukprot:COSAG04_NODE_15177_length_541_cov_0.588235_1_plen_98_part_10
MGEAAGWSVEDVVGWVSRQSLGGAEGVAEKFSDEEVDGKALLSYAELPRDNLKKDFGLSIGKANALWQLIRELTKEDVAGVEVSGESPLRASEGIPPR